MRSKKKNQLLVPKSESIFISLASTKPKATTLSGKGMPAGSAVWWRRREYDKDRNTCSMHKWHGNLKWPVQPLRHCSSELLTVRQLYVHFKFLGTSDWKNNRTTTGGASAEPSVDDSKQNPEAAEEMMAAWRRFTVLVGISLSYRSQVWFMMILSPKRNGTKNIWMFNEGDLELFKLGIETIVSAGCSGLARFCCTSTNDAENVTANGFQSINVPRTWELQRMRTWPLLDRCCSWESSRHVFDRWLHDCHGGCVVSPRQSKGITNPIAWKSGKLARVARCRDSCSWRSCRGNDVKADGHASQLIPGTGLQMLDDSVLILLISSATTSSRFGVANLPLAISHQPQHSRQPQHLEQWNKTPNPWHPNEPYIHHIIYYIIHHHYK